MTDEKKTEKKQVTITEVLESKSGTSQKTGKPWTVYSFKAKNGDGNSVTYKTLSTSIGELVKPNLKCEIEFEISERSHEGNTYIDRNVSQMWIDGKPVRDTEKKGWQPRGADPENRASIEKQVIWKGYVEALIAEKHLPEDIEHVILSWARQALGIPDKPTGKTKQEAELDKAFNELKGAESVPPMPNPAAFWKVCKAEFGLMPNQVRSELNLDVNEVPLDLTEAYLTLLAPRRGQ